MKCATCHHDNDAAALFCEECGSKYALTCTNCGTELKPTAKFCVKCGTGTSAPVAEQEPSTHSVAKPFSPSINLSAQSRRSLAGERKQVTVLFCDLADSMQWSTRLDPEQFSEFIHAYHEAVTAVVTSFDGYVAQHLGDGMLVYFGYPQAHEDDAARALHAGLAILSALSSLAAKTRARYGADLVARIGIHTGLVVVGAVGSPAGIRQEQLALGDVPNLAARLQGLAAPNTAYITDTTRRLAGGRFKYTDLGVRAIKGLVEPAKIWQVIGADTESDRFAAATQFGITPLVGRTTEIGLLFERWQFSQEGDGQVVLLSGQPGIGKSRTMNALREKLRGEVQTILRFQCSP